MIDTFIQKHDSDNASRYHSQYDAIGDEEKNAFSGEEEKDENEKEIEKKIKKIILNKAFISTIQNFLNRGVGQKFRNFSLKDVIESVNLQKKEIEAALGILGFKKDKFKKYLSSIQRDHLEDREKKLKYLLNNILQKPALKKVQVDLEKTKKRINRGDYISHIKSEFVGQSRLSPKDD